jgi:glycine hydroxymethyltransferase
MAHIGGLVAAGVCPSPVPHCDFVTTTTNKTLGGPRGGLVLCRAEQATAVDKAVFPGMQGGALNSAIAAKAAVFGIAADDAFRSYAELVCANAQALAETLAGRGHVLLTGGTDTHMVVVDLRATDLDGTEGERRLSEIAIVANRNVVPFDPRPPMVTSGLRLGTAAGTMRRLGPDEFREVGDIVAGALAGEPPAGLRGRVLAVLNGK